MTWEVWLLGGLGFVFLNLLAIVLVKGGSVETAEEIELRGRLERHDELLTAMVTLEAELGRIPTTREVWERALEDSGGEPPAGEST